MSNVHCVSNMSGSTASIVDKCASRFNEPNVCYMGTCAQDTCGTFSPCEKNRLFCFCDAVAPSSDMCNCAPSEDNVAFYTQIIVDGDCEIPIPKPDAEKLLKVHSKASILKVETVKSKEINDDGAFVDGKKVLVAGFLNLGFEYSACTADQKVHFFHCNIPFDGLVLEADGSLLPLSFDLNNFVVHVSVEQIQVQQTGPRCFSKVAILIIWLEPRR